MQYFSSYQQIKVENKAQMWSGLLTNVRNQIKFING